MEFYKDDFCRFLLESKALKIGQNPAREDGNYVLKSGRISPFFMNMGNLNNGDQLLRLSLAYAIVSMRDIMEFLRENRRLPAGTRRSIENTTKNMALKAFTWKN